MERDFQIKDGSRIAVIGGGPAGSFFAHFAQKWAARLELAVSVTIFDGKDFLQKGPSGCNLCAGVIAESLNLKLKEEGIFLPEKRIINRVDGYTLHVNSDSLLLSCTENEIESIATVFRGNGPRFSSFPETVSFDDFLLSWAQDRGAKVISQPVWDLALSEHRSAPVKLFYGEKDRPQKFEADFVVGAFGVNTHLIKKIQNLGFGYKPPSTLTTFQAELRLGKEEVLKHFANNIHIYMPKSKTIRYATVIPKGDYMTVSIIGKKDVSKDIFQEFLGLNEIKSRIPNLKPHCFCYPKIVVSPSKNPFTNRFVMIGDASFSRHYKNGIESAFITARLAAECAFSRSIHAHSFSSFYRQRAKKLIIHDNHYGRLLFKINDIISSVPFLTGSHLSLAKSPDHGPSARKIRFILWNMFTGNIPYRDIFKISLSPQLQKTLFLHTFNLLFRKIKKNVKSFFHKIKKKSRASKTFDRLKDGDLVVIIGSGPAGSSCAIKLKMLALSKRIDLRILIYEGKRFEKKSYYNQCLGVLSPPLKEIMENELAVPFPWKIVQKEINGYYLHTDHNILKISGEHEPSYACRRVEFDNYLFQKVKEMGIEVIPARVTDLDFHRDGVMVYSESNNIKANMVVGAFGLDDGMAKVFERKTPYRQPKFLYSIVTKIHPGEKAMKMFGKYLHAFLPAFPPEVEFGAITPKGNHLSMNIAGKNVDSKTMDDFLSLPLVRGVLPHSLSHSLPDLNYFKGKFPTFPAKSFFGNRYIMVGDAAGLNRPFKGKGINSAIMTGIKAAETIIHHGISKEAFLHYLHSCRELTADIPYGKIIRTLTLQCKKYGLLDIIFETSKRELKLKKAFFNIVSGQKTYRKIWIETKNLKLLFRLIGKVMIGRIFKKDSLAASKTLF